MMELECRERKKLLLDYSLQETVRTAETPPPSLLLIGLYYPPGGGAGCVSWSEQDMRSQTRLYFNTSSCVCKLPPLLQDANYS
ncbi:hypothetical protein FKM82_000459 [Ascaphus truei]